MNRDEAREKIANAGITSDNVTVKQCGNLWHLINVEMIDSGNYNTTYRMNQMNESRYMTCKTEQWEEREAVSFNRDGFIGFAGWAGEKNVNPILKGVQNWLNKMKREKKR